MITRGTIVALGLVVLLNATADQAEASLENLQIAYNNESNAKARYSAFAAKADEEGYSSVAALFRAMAHAELIHARKHALIIEKLGIQPTVVHQKTNAQSTRENLETALQDEKTEQDATYPAFRRQAETEGNAAATQSFKNAQTASASEVKLLQEAINNLNAWKAAGTAFLVCRECGYTSLDQKLQACPVCGAPRDKFDTVR